MIQTEGDINFSKARKNWQLKQKNKHTQDLLAEDSRYFLHQALSTPCLDAIETTSGSILTSTSGKKYYDFHGNNVHQLGHGNKAVREAIITQIQSLSFCPRRYTNSMAINLAKKLADLLPGSLNRSLFVPSGTNAISIALKLARVVTGKHKIISTWDSFHGASLDTISVGGEAIFRKNMGPLMPGVERIPPATTYRGIFTEDNNDDIRYAEYLDYVIQKEGDIGALVIETIRNTDVQIPSKKYWQKVREICTKNKILLILDEIPIALGRTGKMFAFEHFNIEPDILCLGKGLGGGIWPFAAIITRDEYNVAQNISLGHYTHEKSPIGAAAALATIEFIEKQQILNKVQEDGEYMKQKLQKLQEKHKLIGDVRGVGLLWGIELVNNKETKEKALVETEQILYDCLSDGLSFKVSQGNVIQLSPPLTINRNDLDSAIRIIDMNLEQIK
jgi:4-aminobutyrate aminotransferase